jgi:amidase
VPPSGEDQVVTPDLEQNTSASGGSGGLDLISTGVDGLLLALLGGAITAQELTEACQARIAKLDPTLGAVISVNPRAGEDAAQSDARRAAGVAPGPLEGIPVLVKDNIAAGGMPTTAGSLALSASRPADAACVARLRRAGAVILGKANLSEWANFRSERSVSGWSSVRGQARNPHVLDRSPSGSSSGSAVAVAAELAPLAVGTETDGSILCPASACGVVGIKPTLGLVSRRGIVPISHRQDTAGPLARTVREATLLLSVLAGPDPGDPATVVARPPAVWNLAGGTLPRRRLGVWREGCAAADPSTMALLDRAVAALREAGAEVVDPVQLPGADGISEPELLALCHEFKHDIDAYLAGLAIDHPKSLAELIEDNLRNADRVMPFFGQDLFERAAATSGDLSDEKYAAARAEASNRASRGLGEALSTHRLDAVVSLTTAPACPIDPIHGDRHIFTTTEPAAVAGWPAVTVPAGELMGLPVGLTFMGAAWSDLRLLGLAQGFEAAIGAGPSPRYLPTVAI